MDCARQQSADQDVLFARREDLKFMLEKLYWYEAP